jgi:hypothetical protein
MSRHSMKKFCYALGDPATTVDADKKETQISHALSRMALTFRFYWAAFAPR